MPYANGNRVQLGKSLCVSKNRHRKIHRQREKLKTDNEINTEKSKDAELCKTGVDILHRARKLKTQQNVYHFQTIIFK